MLSVIAGATIIDGVADEPVEDQSILIENGRIVAIAKRGDLPVPPSAEVLDATGKYVIPGLMDANVHLMMDTRMEMLLRYEDRYETLITEAAQIALLHGITTVYDTWGPRRPLMAVRDRIERGEVTGSRIFCGGNIIGLDGPISHDFYAKALEVASAGFVARINSIWAENVGSHLMWMTPEQVQAEVRAYIGQGVDFIKYASSDHRGWGAPFLAFSATVQRAITEEARRAGITAQAHTTSVESLRVAVESGVHIIQHCDITGPVPIPETTLDLLIRRGVAATIFPMTANRYRRVMEKCGGSTLGKSVATWELNDRNLLASGARLLLATDAGLMSPAAATDPYLSTMEWWVGGEDRITELGAGHFHWLKAMEEKGMPPMAALQAATSNIAAAYGKSSDLGSVTPGKIADLVILDRDPLAAAENYRAIHAVMKQGVVVDRTALPTERVLTRAIERADADNSHGHNASFGRHPLCC